MGRSLTGRFLLLTFAFVLLAEVLIFVPSMARFRADYLDLRLERAQIASLVLLAADDIAPELEAELLENAGVYNVVLRRDAMRQLVLASPVPEPISATYDLRSRQPFRLIRDAVRALLNREGAVIRVIGAPVAEGGELIEVTMPTAPLRQAMLDYGSRILGLSLMIVAISAALLVFAVRRLMVEPIQKVVRHMRSYASAPEDARRIISPNARVSELRSAEEALYQMQTDLTGALRQKDRLAQLGGAVARISHDLRNILTSSQLFTDRIEGSSDPVVQRLAPKLVGSISRAVSLCESTLAFGRAEEPPPRLTRFALAELVEEVIAAERLSAEGSDLSYAVDIPGGLVLRADAEQLYRVLSNLTRNARQAIVASGEPGEIRVQAREDDAAWLLTVCDTGPGLPEKARAHLFEPFQGRAGQGGSGLGLAIASELVRGHGGTLVLARSDEAGTCFEITLPRHEITQGDAAE